jgi:hypothetical protein
VAAEEARSEEAKETHGARLESALRGEEARGLGLAKENGGGGGRGCEGGAIASAGGEGGMRRRKGGRRRDVIFIPPAFGTG